MPCLKTDIKEEAIRGIKIPTLIMSGDKDVNTLEHAVEMSRQIEKASLAIFPGGHGDFIGEIFSFKPGQKVFPALPVVEAFLSAAHQ
jgi:pimeloyl-ACP methyl ester carboxylesterase